MSLSQVVKREFEVAFSKHGQPLWFRTVKYCVLLILLYLIRDSEYLWLVLLSAFVISFTVHFWFRYKTKGWTQSYGPWKCDQIIKS
ncbi:hypothetical protein [Leptospira sanjuanensis]|uniref:hypothetical protein n=1 Tax=Leptospira sanjuanensis TaxID=2879643 RepID=UPI001EE8281B|nr:hypothetical protein [Leptospira sanjuanensis]MCG6166947.1 hypothetical protein [Leptospira sanjuanensis]